MCIRDSLALVKGDPAGRRAFLDELLVARQPRWAGVRADYERILKQRNALLKSAAPVLRKGSSRRRSASLAPVSYTHLDVYKRQLEGYPQNPQHL